MSDTWLAPNEIDFRRWKVEWLLPFLPNLASGHYVPDPKETGYAGGNGTHNGKAPFITVSELYAEITARVKECRYQTRYEDNDDGYLFLCRYLDGDDDSKIARLTALHPYEIDWRINRVISYISSGPVRRWHDTEKRPGQSYEEFVNHRRRVMRFNGKQDLSKAQLAQRKGKKSSRRR